MGAAAREADRLGFFHPRTAYLGPAGSWMHQAALDLFGGAGLVPLSRDELFAAYAAGTVERACVPVTTSIVGMTPYVDGAGSAGRRNVAGYPVDARLQPAGAARRAAGGHRRGAWASGGAGGTRPWLDRARRTRGARRRRAAARRGERPSPAARGG